MITFAFARVTNGKIPDDTYIIVIMKGCRDEIIPVPDPDGERCYMPGPEENEGPSFANPWYFICPVMSILRPRPDEIEGIDGCDREGWSRYHYYLDKVAVAKYTGEQLERWRKEKKIVVC